MALLFAPPRFVPVDGDGHVRAGAKLYAYETGTTTPKNTYSDSGLTTPNANPVVADANGLFGSIYLLTDADYKFILTDADDATIWTVDPYLVSTPIIDGSVSLDSLSDALQGLLASRTPGGRLTLTSATPVLTGNVTAATTLYYTPHVHNFIPIYDGEKFVATAFSELTNATAQSSTGKAGPAAVTTDSNYDLFVWDDSGTTRLTRGAAWNSDTARSSTTENDLQRVSGILTNANAITNGPAANRGTYVGTVRSDGSSQLNWHYGAVGANGTEAKLHVWNMYNRVEVAGFVGDNTNSWNYTTATWRSANNSATMRVSFVAGLREDSISANYAVNNVNSAGPAATLVGVGADSTSAPSGRRLVATTGTNSILLFGDHAMSGLGYHYLQALEFSQATGTTTWYGDNNGTDLQTGLTYRWRC